MRCLISYMASPAIPSPRRSPTLPERACPPRIVNVLWGLFNLAVGHVLWHLGKVRHGNHAALISFAGAVAISTMLSVHFRNKHAN